MLKCFLQYFFRNIFEIFSQSFVLYGVYKDNMWKFNYKKLFMHLDLVMNQEILLIYSFSLIVNQNLSEYIRNQIKNTQIINIRKY